MMDKNRLQYMDVARGLAMFVVVYSHIQLFCLPGYSGSAFIDFMRLYYLSGFFFIAGFFVQERLAYGSFVDVRKYIVKKFWQLLLPTIICMAVFLNTADVTFMTAISDEAKWGYWFTFVLFEMCAIFSLSIWLFGRAHKPVLVNVGALLVAAVSFVLFRCNIPHNFGYKLLSVGGLTNYLPFFIAGYIFRQTKDYLPWIKSYYDKIIIVLLILIIGYYFGLTPSFVTSMSVVVVMLYAANMLCNNYLMGGVKSDRIQTLLLRY